ncbi:MAG: DinB family protein [Vicinamibacterales bacterium]
MNSEQAKFLVEQLAGTVEGEFQATCKVLAAVKDDNRNYKPDEKSRTAASFLAMMNNHSIHHRGQLAAYLRPMGSKVPAIYGDSADEPMKS